MGSIEINSTTRVVTTISNKELEDGIAHALAEHQDRVFCDMPVKEFVISILQAVFAQRNTYARAEPDAHGRRKE